jgi:hypothetical protein
MSRYHEIRQSQPTVRERFPALATLFDQLDECSDAQYRAAGEFLDADKPTGRVLYPGDLVLLSLIARSFELIDAFVGGVERWNLSLGSMLVRLQIDNVLRAHLIATSPEPHAILVHLLNEEPLHKYRLPESQVLLLPEADRRDNRATDKNLRALTAAVHPWVQELYETASKWVHHSAAHLLTTWTVTPDDSTGAISGRIPVDVDQFDEAFLMGLLGAMLRASDTLLAYAEGWVERKKELMDSNGQDALASRPPADPTDP